MMKKLLVLLLALFPSVVQAQLGTVIPVPVAQFVDDNGSPLDGGLLYTCSAASSCPGTALATYNNSDLDPSHQNSNPVVLDSAGRATIYLSRATYKFVLKTSAGVTVWTQDNIASYAPWNLNQITGKITYSAATVLTLSSNAVTPTQNFHALDTSGGAQNLNTITTTNVTSGFPLTLYGNNPGSNPVTVKNGSGNITLRKGDFVLNSANRYIVLLLSGSTWYEISRSDIDGAIAGPDLKSYYETSSTVTIAAAAATFDLSNGNWFSVALNAAFTATFSNPAASGKVSSFSIKFTADGTGRIITWPASVKWPSGVAPTPTSTNGKVDVYSFFTLDGGTTWYGVIVGQNY